MVPARNSMTHGLLELPLASFSRAGGPSIRLLTTIQYPCGAISSISPAKWERVSLRRGLKWRARYAVATSFQFPANKNPFSVQRKYLETSAGLLHDSTTEDALTTGVGSSHSLNLEPVDCLISDPRNSHSRSRTATEESPCLVTPCRFFTILLVSCTSVLAMAAGASAQCNEKDHKVVCTVATVLSSSSATPLARRHSRRSLTPRINPSSNSLWWEKQTRDGTSFLSPALSTTAVRHLASADVVAMTLPVSVVERSSAVKKGAGGSAQEEELRAEKEFQMWLKGIRDEALQRGIRKKTVDQALHGIRPLPKVIEKDRNQPEVKLTATDYLQRVVNEYRILKGVRAFEENSQVLKRVVEQYGVPPEILVSIWGIESSYGSFTGSFDIIQALLTLAYDNGQPMRSTYFRNELLEAIAIMDQGHVPKDMERPRGSWAGAMGQCQFMPSSFRTYAVDFDGDGRADIWSSKSDIFASMANYLVQNGWRKGEPYGHKVKLSPRLDSSLLGLKVKKTVKEWQKKYRVEKEAGEPDLPPDALASVVAPDGPQGPAFLACHNFQVVMRYNPSQLYAMSVCHLAGRLLQAPPST